MADVIHKIIGIYTDVQGKADLFKQYIYKKENRIALAELLSVR